MASAQKSGIGYSKSTRYWIDIREGRTAQFSNQTNARRAAKIFRRFIRKAGGEAETGVRADQGWLKMTRDRAVEVIRNEDEMPASGASKTVQRTFREAVRRSNPTDCDHDWTECDCGLFQFRKTDTYQLAVREEQFRDYLGQVADLIEEVELVEDADDAVKPVEALADEAMAELDALTDGGPADGVVSNREGRPSAADETGRGDF